MHGPVWKDHYGVTGEKNSVPNYVTTTDSEGRTVTLTGESARMFRETQGMRA